MKMPPAARIAAYLILALIMPVVIVLTATFHYAFDDVFFLKAFQENKTAEMLGLDSDGMTRVVNNMTDYISGKTDSMDITVPINGVETRFYNERELAHMVDVRKLMDLGQRGRMVLLIMGLILLMALRCFAGREAFWRGLMASALGAMGFAALLGVLAATDFTAAFYKFHEMFFTNDLWLLDPATDRLIQMLPESIFFGITTRIILASGLTVLAIGGAAAFGLHFSRKAAKEAVHAHNS